MVNIIRSITVSQNLQPFCEGADLLHEFLLLLVQRLHLVVDLLVVLLATHVHRAREGFRVALVLGDLGDVSAAVQV